MRSNIDRADKADSLVSNYETDSSLEECLSDLLGDIRHLCDKYEIDFAERDAVGYRNYVGEIGEAKRLERKYRGDPDAGRMSTGDGLGA